jgi:hypothetical protein
MILGLNMIEHSIQYPPVTEYADEESSGPPAHSRLPKAHNTPTATSDCTPFPRLKRPSSSTRGGRYSSAIRTRPLGVRFESRLESDHPQRAIAAQSKPSKPLAMTSRTVQRLAIGEALPGEKISFGSASPANRLKIVLSNVYLLRTVPFHQKQAQVDHLYPARKSAAAFPKHPARLQYRRYGLRFR